MASGVARQKLWRGKWKRSEARRGESRRNEARRERADPKRQTQRGRRRARRGSVGGAVRPWEAVVRPRGGAATTRRCTARARQTDWHWHRGSQRQWSPLVTETVSLSRESARVSPTCAPCLSFESRKRAKCALGYVLRNRSSIAVTSQPTDSAGESIAVRNRARSTSGLVVYPCADKFISWRDKNGKEKYRSDLFGSTVFQGGGGGGGGKLVAARSRREKRKIGATRREGVDGGGVEARGEGEE